MNLGSCSSFLWSFVFLTLVLESKIKDWKNLGRKRRRSDREGKIKPIPWGINNIYCSLCLLIKSLATLICCSFYQLNVSIASIGIKFLSSSSPKVLYSVTFFFLDGFFGLNTILLKSGSSSMKRFFIGCDDGN